MLNGITTRSPTAICCTSSPTATTRPMGSWPRMSPGTMNGASGRYRWRSDPQIAVEVISTMASVGSLMMGSETSSMPCHVTARTLSSWSSREPVAQPPLVEAEEALLVRPDLGDRHLVEAGLGERAERLDVAVGVGPAGRALGR